jgi:hypothetical protein
MNFACLRTNRKVKRRIKREFVKYFLWIRGEIGNVKIYDFSGRDFQKRQCLLNVFRECGCEIFEEGESLSFWVIKTSVSRRRRSSSSGENYRSGVERHVLSKKNTDKSHSKDLKGVFSSGGGQFGFG